MDRIKGHGRFPEEKATKKALETKTPVLLAFLRHCRRYLYTTNPLERLAKEVKRRTKVVEVFYGEGAVEKLLYLVLSQLDEV